MNFKDSTSKWWKARSSKTLREIQIEVLGWAIEEEKKIGAKEYAADLEYLNQALQKLKASNEPIQPDGAGYSRICRRGGYEGN